MRWRDPKCSNRRIDMELISKLKMDNFSVTLTAGFRKREGCWWVGFWSFPFSFLHPPILAFCRSIKKHCSLVLQIEVYIAGGRMFDGNIVGYDVHYNVAIINILSDVPLPVATLRLLDDSVSIDPALVHSSRDNFQPRPHSSAFKICAEEMVVALGRNCGNSDIMVAPGKFR